MKINIITPQGYCGGVKNALNIVYKSIDDTSIPKPIYLLGSIIHNHHVIDDLKSKGIILIEEKGTPRFDLLDQINKGTVIFSAHGVSDRVYKKANEKGLHIIDTTCPNVLLIHKNIKEKINAGYACIYIGTKNHPECEGVLEISSKIILIEAIEQIENIDISDKKIYITNQTTLSLFQTEHIYSKLIEKYPNAIIDNKICNATTIRQQAILNQEPVDLCIIVGDKNSSNTKKLVTASESMGIHTVLVDNLDELKKLDFYNINSISISSGASTPEYIVKEIIEYLQSKK